MLVPVLLPLVLVQSHSMMIFLWPPHSSLVTTRACFRPRQSRGRSQPIMELHRSPTSQSLRTRRMAMVRVACCGLTSVCSHAPAAVREFTTDGIVSSLVVQILGQDQYRFTVAATNGNGRGAESLLSPVVTIQRETRCVLQSESMTAVA